MTCQPYSALPLNSHYPLPWHPSAVILEQYFKSSYLNCKEVLLLLQEKKRNQQSWYCLKYVKFMAVITCQSQWTKMIRLLTPSCEYNRVFLQKHFSSICQNRPWQVYKLGLKLNTISSQPLRKPKYESDPAFNASCQSLAPWTHLSSHSQLTCRLWAELLKTRAQCKCLCTGFSESGVQGSKCCPGLVATPSRRTLWPCPSCGHPLELSGQRVLH